ncbi:winged helix-turn-helix transcriptional regulator [Fulvivirga lutea]|uniref:Helix-turn-helix transcriptional regulator n=1 Tax=Fulvivirga lutea TaxID=2810512 RepID=A0A974WIG9_9BACT|nr:helix-turn-helix domain-containing protein [Fulvivirga lutea]QSE95958.1 helix-turn-helix transcriptional regulator [Fulvivirga lutea]
MDFRSACPINFGLEHFGDKWSLLILRDLMFKGKRHYNEFLSGPEKVSTSVLRDKLRLLEEGGIISKGEDEVKKSRIKYSLTEKGVQLLPLMVELILWSAQYDPDTVARPHYVEWAKRDRQDLIDQESNRLREEHLQINSN